MYVNVFRFIHIDVLVSASLGPKGLRRFWNVTHAWRRGLHSFAALTAVSAVALCATGRVKDPPLRELAWTGGCIDPSLESVCGAKRIRRSG